MEPQLDFTASGEVADSHVAAPKRRSALRLIDTKALQREQWLQVRRSGIGSSDAAAAAGLNPYQSRLALWLDKTGRAPVEEKAADSSSDPMYWGSLLEPVVAAHYTKRTGYKVRCVRAVLQHPQVAWMLANIDREVLCAPDVQILECKTAGIQGSRLWRDGVPEYVQLQVLHQLAVTGKQAADVAVLLGGQKLEIFRINRNEVMIAHLMALEEEFWGYVQRDQAPPADGSSSAERALRELFARDNGACVDWTHDTEMSNTFSDLLRVRTELAALSAQEAKLKQHIQQQMGEASMAQFELGEVRYKRSKDAVTTDWKALARSHPDVVAQFSAVEPGSRRFLVHPYETPATADII